MSDLKATKAAYDLGLKEGGAVVSALKAKDRGDTLSRAYNWGFFAALGHGELAEEGDIEKWLKQVERDEAFVRSLQDELDGIDIDLTVENAITAKPSEEQRRVLEDYAYGAIQEWATKMKETDEDDGWTDEEREQVAHGLRPKSTASHDCPTWDLRSGCNCPPKRLRT